MKKDITPINKGNYSMDTKEREYLFNYNRAYGYEKEYKDYRDKCAKEKMILEYPY